MSSVGVKNDDKWNNKDGSLFVDGYNEMMKRIQPETVLYYGDMIDGVEGNIIRIPSFYAKNKVADKSARAYRNTLTARRNQRRNNR